MPRTGRAERAALSKEKKGRTMMGPERRRISFHGTPWKPLRVPDPKTLFSLMD
jgi:hypothetical protein